MSINLLSSGVIPLVVESVTAGSVTASGNLSAFSLNVYNATAGVDATQSSITGKNRSYTTFAVNNGGGGLDANHLQLFSYGADEPVIAQCFNIFPDGTFGLNRYPLDSARMGTTTGTGSAVSVSVPSINAGSTVVFHIVGTSNVGGFAAYNSAVLAPSVLVTADVGFAVTATSGLIYNYEVVG